MSARGRRLGGILLLVVVALTACVAPSPPLAFSPPSLPPAAVGAPYRAKIAITGNETPVGGMSVGEGTLPPGLELALGPGHGADAGSITGVPTTAGEYRFTVSVWCYGTNRSGQTGSRAYVIRVE